MHSGANDWPNDPQTALPPERQTSAVEIRRGRTFRCAQDHVHLIDEEQDEQKTGQEDEEVAHGKAEPSYCITFRLSGSENNPIS